MEARVEHIGEEKPLKWCVGASVCIGSGEAAKKIEVVCKSQCDEVACNWHRIIRSYGVATFE
jgi:alkylated DNA nucleotide flippase Atl1